MIRPVKFFLYLCLLVCLFLFFNIYKLNADGPKVESEFQVVLSSKRFTADSKDGKWQPVTDTMHKFFVYSAFLETRSDLQKKPFKGDQAIRIIATTQFDKVKNVFGKTKVKIDQVYCRYWYDEHSTKNMANESDIVPAELDYIKENWGLKYSACFLYCPLKKKDRVPTSVSIYAKSEVVTSYTNEGTITLSKPGNRILVHKPEDKSKVKSLAACVKPIHFDFNKVWELVEWIEFHRELGVSHFYLYNHTMAQNTSCVLRNYIAEGLVTVLDWNGLPFRFQKDIRTENMFASMNDCLYRGMYKHKYLAFMDFDEYLVPKKHDNLLKLLESYDTPSSKFASLMFRNAFFYLQWEDDPEINGTELITLRKTTRKTALHREKTRSKYICKPERVLQVGNHFVWETTKKAFSQMTVDPDDGFMHHYRICEFGGDQCVKQESTTDRTAWKWGNQIIKRMDYEQHKLNKTCLLSPITL